MMTTDDDSALERAQRIADGLQFACRLPDAKPDFTACGGPAAEAYWDYFTPARITSLLAAIREHHFPRRLMLGERISWVPRRQPVQVCASCRDDEGETTEWPCPEFTAITRELTGAQLREDDNHD